MPVTTSWKGFLLFEIILEGFFSSFLKSYVCLASLTKTLKATRTKATSKHFTSPRAVSQECNRYLMNNS